MKNYNNLWEPTIVRYFFIVLVVVLFCFPWQSFGQEVKDPWKRHSGQGNLSSGKIISPPAGAKVPRQFHVNGTIEGKVRNLWLVERIGTLYWPKEPKLNIKDGGWRGRVIEGGYPPEGNFELVLVDVSDEVSKKFIEWLHSGHRSGFYPGIAEIDLGEDVKILDQRPYILIME